MSAAAKNDSRIRAKTQAGTVKPSSGTPEQWREKALAHLRGARRAFEDRNLRAALDLLNESINYAWAADIPYTEQYWADARALQERLPEESEADHA